MIVLFGAKGSMGRRYLSILRFLKIPCIAYDRGDFSLEDVVDKLRSSDGAIVATPTDMHLALCSLIAAETPTVPILCEKPLSKKLGEVEAILGFPNRITMMTQYAMLDPSSVDGHETVYDYYDSGKDGLGWDCIQLLGLARGPVDLRAESPVWRCVLNGRRLTLHEVQQAYVEFVDTWMAGKVHQEPDWILLAHEKAAAYAPAGCSMPSQHPVIEVPPPVQLARSPRRVIL